MKYFTKLNQENKPYEYDEKKRDLLQVKLHVLQEQMVRRNKNLMFHNTSIPNLLKIMEGGKMKPKAYSKEEMTEIFQGIAIESTNQELGMMELKILEFVIGDWDIDDDLRTRLQVLKYLINDKKPKFYLLDHLNPLYMYLQNEMSVILCIDTKNIEVIEKYSYKETYRQNGRSKHISYWINDNEDKDILGYVQGLGKYDRSEWFTYQEIPFDLVKSIIVIDKFQVKEVIKNESKRI